jgi:hypothetical protein
MFGTFQQSNLRIEVNASKQKICDSLLLPNQFRQWLYPQTFSRDLQECLQKDTTFTSWIGPISILHQVVMAQPDGLGIILSKGIDGYHEWRWGEGWIQSCIAGISPLPINLGQTLSLLRLQIFLTTSAET